MAKRWIDRFAELMMEVPPPPPEDMALARAMFALAERGRPLPPPPGPRVRPVVEGTVREQVVTVVREAGHPMRPKDVHAVVNGRAERPIPLGTVNTELLRAAQDGQLVKPRPGVYAVPEEGQPDETAEE